MGQATEAAGEVVVRWGNLKKYFEDLETVAGQAADIEKYAKEEVFNRTGFDFRLCVLQPLADMMDTCGEVFGDLRSTFDESWEDLIASLALTAEEIQEADGIQGQAYLKAFIDLAGDS